MPEFDEHPEFRSLLRAARANPDDDLPRLALADWLDERGWTEEATYYRNEVSVALWRLEFALRKLLPLDLSPGNLPTMAAVSLFAAGLNKVAEQIREAAIQHRAQQRLERDREAAERSGAESDPPTPKKRPRKKPQRKK